MNDTFSQTQRDNWENSMLLLSCAFSRYSITLSYILFSVCYVIKVDHWCKDIVFKHNYCFLKGFRNKDKMKIIISTNSLS